MLLPRIARRLLPFTVRVELLRLQRWPQWLLETPTLARRHLTSEEQPEFGHLLAQHRSPLERVPGAVSARLQRGKERNVGRAAALLNGLLIAPDQICSYHRCVGRPSRLRGFRMGLELHEGAATAGVGGGCCQISNALYLLALLSGMNIVERHRHGLDLFPDHARTVPFGCGATVFYNYADLRFANPLPHPVLLRFRIEQNELIGEIWTTVAPVWRVEIYEQDHRYYRDQGHWMRENRIRRRFLRPDGEVMLDQEIAHNRGRVLYEPPEEWRC